MKRTQFYIPYEMYQELAFEAKREARKVAEVVRDLLAESLWAKKAKRKINVFKELSKIAKTGPKDLSKTYKNYLFGSQSKWKKV